MRLSSEYGYSIYNKTYFKWITPHIFKKFYNFCRIVFHFPVKSFLFLSSLWLKIFPAYILSWWISRGLQKKERLNFLRYKHIWTVIKDYLVFKNTLSSASRRAKIALCGDNRGIWRFLLKYLITVHHNRLVFEQWTKRSMTISSSESQNQQSEVLCLQNKKTLLIKVQSIV